MQQPDTRATASAPGRSDDVEALAGLRTTTLSRLAPDRVKVVADRAKELHRRRTKVSVAAFNSSI